MKRSKLILSIVIVAVAFCACKKDSSEVDNDYMSEIVGKYRGEFTNQAGLKSSSQGKADVATLNNQLQIHCYGDLMDTTFVMDAFENGDSVMVCDTGEAFEMQYGHMGNGSNHMMDMHNDESEWQNHMNEDHNLGDMHYGGFNMTKHTFEYMFRMMEGDSAYYMVFNGSKN
ncbi:MAG: hypothetical protein JEZ09_19085 [Salinivirgaceae bacterium]|nr:hypothetical protein [Salinivirgaceae bacterium]